MTPDEEEFSDDTHVSVNHRLRRTISLPADLNVFRGDNRPPFLTNEIRATFNFLPPMSVSGARAFVSNYFVLVLHFIFPKFLKINAINRFSVLIFW